MTTAPPASSSSGQNALLVLRILMWLAWIVVIVVADFMGFMMFAFADSPGSAKSAQLMIVPMFAWFGITFVGGILLLIFKGWWQIPLAFALAISPPFLAFLGYNLLAGAGNVQFNVGPPPPPAVRVNTPPGGFAPTPPSTTQPDFQKRIDAATQAAKEGSPR